jgi:hypothetical protein
MQLLRLLLADLVRRYALLGRVRRVGVDGSGAITGCVLAPGVHLGD